MEFEEVWNQCTFWLHDQGVTNNGKYRLIYMFGPEAFLISCGIALFFGYLKLNKRDSEIPVYDWD